MNSQPLNNRGITLTTLRNRNVDHVGIRTSGGIIDVAAASNALGIAQFPLTVEEVIAGKGNVDILQELARSAPPETIHSESSVEYGPVSQIPRKLFASALTTASISQSLVHKFPISPTFSISTIIHSTGTKEP